MTAEEARREWMTITDFTPEEIEEALRIDPPTNLNEELAELEAAKWLKDNTRNSRL